MTSSSHPKQRTHERQAGLVQAALQLAAEKSPAEITTGDLAQVVGITQGAVFKHFESKEAIWLAVLDWAHQALMARLQAVVSESGAQAVPLAVLRAVFMAHIQFVQAYPGVPRLVFQELQHAKATPLITAGARVMVTGRLEVGSWTDPETGFVSQIRLRDAYYRKG